MLFISTAARRQGHRHSAGPNADSTSTAVRELAHPPLWLWGEMTRDWMTPQVTSDDDPPWLRVRPVSGQVGGKKAPRCRCRCRSRRHVSAAGCPAAVSLQTQKWKVHDSSSD